MATFLALIIGIALMPIAAEALRGRMSTETQRQAPGEIAHLPQGATHYRWTGREEDPVVVCIHGLSTPSYVFAGTVRSLTSLGYRVLTYDLYGRGYSARVPGPQNTDFFLTQLRALLANQEVRGPITLVGFSMGGQIATAYAASENESVEKLVVVATAGLSDADASKLDWVWRAPVIGDWMTRVFGGMALRRQLVEHRTTPTVIPDFEDRQAAETRIRGYLPAILSSRRHLLSQSSAKDHGRLAMDGVPVLAIWGGSDPVIPARSAGELARINPNAQHVEIKGAGHTVLQTHPSEVALALRGFLRR